MKRRRFSVVCTLAELEELAQWCRENRIPMVIHHAGYWIKYSSKYRGFASERNRECMIRDTDYELFALRAPKISHVRCRTCAAYAANFYNNSRNGYTTATNRCCIDAFIAVPASWQMEQPMAPNDGKKCPTWIEHSCE